MKYPRYAQELAVLLDEDQAEKNAFAKRYFKANDCGSIEAEKRILHENTAKRTARMLEILDYIGRPTL